MVIHLFWFQMKKKNNRPIEIEIINYGLYEEWNRDSPDLPQFKELTTQVEAQVGIEFGMIVEIRKARGRYLDFQIDHPLLPDESGNIMTPFTGTFRVKQNPYLFFLGDTIWSPIDNKKGKWVLSIRDGNQILISKTLQVI